MKNLLAEINLDNPQILELGAATGVLTRWLISQYGGNGVLVDKNKSSLNAYNSLKDINKQFIIKIVECTEENKFEPCNASKKIVEILLKRTELQMSKSN